MTRGNGTTRWVALLRGVNVGGVKVTSADLKAALEGAGMGSVRTVLASGNALLDAPGSEAEVVERVMAALQERFGRAIPVLVRSQPQANADIEACPFPADSQTHHAYLVYTADDDAARYLHEVATGALTSSDPNGSGVGATDESVAAGDRLLYWWCPRGSSLSTPVSVALTKAPKKVLTTTRNLRTMLRLRSG